jgi:hypothetical protein
MTRLDARTWLLCGVFVLPGVGGCGAQGPARHEITGRITYKGQPVDEGFINFEPQDGQPSRDGAMILAGDYRIPKEKGLFPGKYRVVIIIGDGLSGEGSASPDAPPRPRGGTPGKERAPPEFNRQSKLVREVTADGPNQFDFDIP